MEHDELPGCSFSITIVDSTPLAQARVSSPNGCLFVWLGSVVSGFLKSHLSVRHCTPLHLGSPSVSTRFRQPSHRVKLRKQTNKHIHSAPLLVVVGGLLFGPRPIQLAALSAIGTHQHSPTPTYTPTPVWQTYLCFIPALLLLFRCGINFKKSFWIWPRTQSQWHEYL